MNARYDCRAPSPDFASDDTRELRCTQAVLRAGFGSLALPCKGPAMMHAGYDAREPGLPGPPPSVRAMVHASYGAVELRYTRAINAWPPPLICEQWYTPARMLPGSDSRELRLSGAPRYFA